MRAARTHPLAPPVSSLAIGHSVENIFLGFLDFSLGFFFVRTFGFCSLFSVFPFPLFKRGVWHSIQETTEPLASFSTPFSGGRCRLPIHLSSLCY